MKYSLAAACMILFNSMSIAHAEEGDTSIAIIAGLPSDLIGVEAGYELNEYYGLRGGFGGVKYTNDTTTLNTLGGFAFADYYPMGGIFRISAGTHIGNLGFEYSDGTNKGSVEFNKIRPSLSVGLTSRQSTFVIFGDIGASYVGKADLDIANLDAETKSDAEDVAEQSKISLMLRTGIGFRF